MMLRFEAAPESDRFGPTTGALRMLSLYSMDDQEELIDLLARSIIGGDSWHGESLTIRNKPTGMASLRT
jgi:hypothetical protein